MGWELVGGNPAPGEPWAVANAAAALQAVAQLTDDIAASMQRDHALIGGEVWSGQAHDAYLNDVRQLLPQVDLARDSFRDAAQALTDYEQALAEAQPQATAALSAAESAEADMVGAETRGAAAQENADAQLESYEGTVAAATRVHRQLAAATEPGLHATLSDQLANLEAMGRRQWANHVDAANTAARFAGARADAEARLAEARRVADQIRGEIDLAADVLARRLAAAEHEAHLPNLLHRVAIFGQEKLQKWGPVVIEVLQVAAAVFTVLAFAFPVLAVVALACAAAVFALQLAIDLTNGGGIDREEAFGLGLDLLGVIAAGLPVGAGIQASRVAAAAAETGDAARIADAAQTGLRLQTTAATGATWFGRAQSVLGVGDDIEHKRYRDALIDSGGFVVAGAAAKWSGPLVRQGLGRLDKNSQIHEVLQSASKSMASNPTTRVGEAMSPESRDYLHDLLDTSSHGGRLRPGHSAALNLPHDRVMGHSALDDRTQDTTRDAVDPLTDTAKDMFGDKDKSGTHY